MFGKTIGSASGVHTSVSRVHKLPHQFLKDFKIRILGYLEI